MYLFFCWEDEKRFHLLLWLWNGAEYRFLALKYWYRWIYTRDLSCLLSLNQPQPPNKCINPMVDFFIWCLKQVLNFLIFIELEQQLEGLGVCQKFRTFISSRKERTKHVLYTFFFKYTKLNQIMNYPCNNSTKWTQLFK